MRGANNKNEFSTFYEYAKAQYWEHYLSAMEKEKLQSFREELLREYMLTKDEKLAMLYFDKNDTKMLMREMK